MNIFGWRRRKDAELDEEIRSHLDAAIRDRIERGETPEQARVNELREFGNVGLVKEVTREMWGWTWLEQFMQDLRFGARMLLRQKGFALVAILTLALGIGVNTAIFSVANAILVRPLPIKDADRIIDVHSYLPFHPAASGFSYPDYLELRKQTEAMADLFACSPIEPVLGASGVESKAMIDSDAEELSGFLVTGTYFSALGGKALLGRTLMPEDDQAPGAHPVVVLSHGFWQRRFGAAPDIVEKTILLNGRAFTVVGVAEASFTGGRRKSPDVWVPLLMRDQLNPQDKWLSDRDANWLRVMGRLQSGVQFQQAEAALAVAFSRLKEGRSESARAWEIKILQASLLSLADRQVITPIASVALSAVTMVLLIACLNVAGLMLARMAARQREIAVRLSLGASRGRLLRQLGAESLLLAGVGGLAGLLISRWMAQALSFLAGEWPGRIAIDWRVIVYTLGISVFTAVVVGLAPAWQSTRFNLISALKQEGTGLNQPLARLRLRSALVVGQITLSLVLLLGAGLFARTLLRVGTIDPGFKTEDLSFVNLRWSGYDEARAAQFQRELQECLLATPMVKDAVWVRRVPLWDFPFESDPMAMDSITYRVDGAIPSVTHKDGSVVVPVGVGSLAGHNVVAPNYFAVFEIQFLYGRAFTEQETRDGKAVVVINEALRRRHWPGENPVGKSLWTVEGAREIIGVAKNSRNKLRLAADEPYFYLPLPPKERLQSRLLVRSDAAPGALASALRMTLRSLDPRLKVNVTPFSDVLNGTFELLQLGASLASLFGVLALAMAVMGLYGVTAYVVVQRTHEIGVRMALGAQAGDVVRLVLRQGLRLVIIGVAIGLLISAVATRALEAALYGVSPTDPLTFGAITILLGAVALLACWIPARRATRVDPLIALRHE